MKKYDPKKEYHVNINDKEVINKIQEAKQIYNNFFSKYHKKLDLNNKKSISAIYNAAKEEGIFEKAKEIRELLFGKDMHFYGVNYLWDACVNHCSYCPGSVPNRKKSGDYNTRELTPDQALDETISIVDEGHTHVCYLAGSAPGREGVPKKMVEYLKKLDNIGLDEIILNIEPSTLEGFKTMRTAVKNTSLQFRVFQETYDKKTYKKLHPKGPKADYDFRYESQERALEAGFDNIGLGVLFGLYNFPLEEIEGLKNHSEELNKLPARICLPSANELEGIGVNIPFILEKGAYDNNGNLIERSDYEMFNELMYAAARLAMPLVNIVSSERDRSGMLRILDDYATCTTLNVHPGVGNNTNIFGENEKHFEQTTTFPRDPKKTVEEMRKRGFNPLIKL